MSVIRYLAELANRKDYEPIYFLRYLDGDNNSIYFLDLTQPTGDTYWTDWGGTYDNPTSNRIEVLFNNFLQRVSSYSELTATDSSIFIDGTKAIINLPRPPWSYSVDDTELDELEIFSSFVADETDLSNWHYLDADGNAVKVEPRLKIPKVPQKLSDPISGSTLYPTFNFELINNDGRFDDTETLNYFNTPTRILRSDLEGPTLADFETIRSGLVDYVETNATALKVTGADVFRTFTEPVCNVITADDYPDAPDGSIDKKIPIGYGNLTNVPLIEVGTNKFLAIDPEYIDSVTMVYDGDGASISFTVSDGVITAADAETADVVGKSENRIGEIVKYETIEKAGVLYISSNWDITEADTYINSSARVNFFFDGGSVRDLITQVLKNDLAFLVPKNDGRLTIRQWAEEYAEHMIDSWRIMSIPSKKYQEAKKFFISSANVQYRQNIDSGNYERQALYSAGEDAIKSLYRQRKTGEFETDLQDRTSALDLGERLVDRFGTLSEIVSIDLGYNTSAINLLDRVILNIDINGRSVSNITTWIVREVDPAQDRLTIEAL